jgi:hypothetical protein
MTVDRNYRFKSSWRRGQRKALLKAQGNRCALCPATDRPGARLHQAHLVAAPFGDDTQTILLCALCHRRFDASRASLAAGRAMKNLGAAAAGAPPQRGRLDTPRSKFPFAGALAPSRGPARTSANLQVSGGVGAGSPALPPGYAGVWGDCGPISGDSIGGTATPITREMP